MGIKLVWLMADILVSACILSVVADVTKMAVKKIVSAHLCHLIQLKFIVNK